ncbi:uncharacterized protein LOC135376414 [Ornithodoros turicata]|uniref:uncharacterized protein LOC135376414 n=1 Tax=Ornithodoros turicata TaxID=34597 RepID=UPI0031388F4B
MGNTFAEHLWRLSLSTLLGSLKKAKTVDPTPQGVIVLGSHSVPESVTKVLGLGPKFSLQPATSKAEVLGYIRNVARPLPEDAQASCIRQAVGAVKSAALPRSRLRQMKQVVQYSESADVNLVTADKEGGFVVVPRQLYVHKSEEALDKNFRKASADDERKARTKVLDICGSADILQLAKNVKSHKEKFLKVFYTAKTHKDGVPFRAIVSENGTWQKCVSLFLQRHLSELDVPDPFVIPNSGPVVDYLKGESRNNMTVFSVDVVDLFYSIPHVQLLQSVEDIIERSGGVRFQNNAGVSISTFMELLTVYLSSTVVQNSGQFYIQKKGTPIGSCVSPVLCEIFLAAVDNQVYETLKDRCIFRIFRYVEDYLIFFTDSISSRMDTHYILDLFKANARGLDFTFELPVKGCIQFLDIRMVDSVFHKCWSYHPRSRKAVLPFSSCHTKIVKRGIVRTMLRSALNKSCEHEMQHSFQAQLGKLAAGGYPDTLIQSVSETLITEMRQASTTERRRPEGRPVCIPYVHKISHSIKKVAERHGVPVVLSAPVKLQQLCSRVNNPKPRRGCEVQHKRPFVKCDTSLVYKIPLTCGKYYIGQTGRCLNVRLLEHAAALKNTPSGHLAVHVRDCGCTPLFDCTCTLAKHPNQTVREIHEAFNIFQHGPECVSSPSIALSSAECGYLTDGRTDRDIAV